MKLYQGLQVIYTCINPENYETKKHTLLYNLNGTYSSNKQINGSYFEVDIKKYIIDNKTIAICRPDLNSTMCFEIKFDNVYLNEHDNKYYVSVENILKYLEDNKMNSTKFYRQIKEYFYG